MRAGFGVLDFASLQEPDQMGPGNIQHMDRLLRGEFCMRRHDRDRMPFGHSGQKMTQQGEDCVFGIRSRRGRGFCGYACLAMTSLECQSIRDKRNRRFVS
ncbi:hypothetical protein SALB1_1115 [Salinisphaera sp. LB1]|nr:hypothetical protein SALB1_1115 [Salinisphaera sp. LB1]